MSSGRLKRSGWFKSTVQHGAYHLRNVAQASLNGLASFMLRRRIIDAECKSLWIMQRSSAALSDSLAERLDLHVVGCRRHRADLWSNKQETGYV